MSRLCGLLIATTPRPTPPVAPIGDAIKEVFLKAHVSFKAAAADMGVPQSNLSRSLNEFGPSVARLALLPDSVKRQLWYALRPWFGFQDDAPQVIDVVALDRRVQALETWRKACGE